MAPLSAEAVARALCPRPHPTSRGWMVPCPAHDDRSPSLHISEGKGGRLLFHCHAACDQWAVIAALRARGLWSVGPGIDNAAAPIRHQHPAAHKPDPRTSDYIEQTWQAARPAAGTIVGTYLRSRHLDGPIPPTIRYHPALVHRPSGRRLPAMVAAVQDVAEAVIGLHRTWLRPDGSGKADIAPQRMMLGPCAGGAVRLAPAGETLLVAEGIETCMAAMLASGRPSWAALSTSGLRTLVLPPDTRRVIIAADGDDPGEAAAMAAARRWASERREVRIARPPRGYDFGDLVADRCPPTRSIAA